MMMRPIQDPRAGIIFFDDVITTGRHYRRAQALLEQYHPNFESVGIFIARRSIHPPGY